MRCEPIKYKDSYDKIFIETRQKIKGYKTLKRKMDLSNIVYLLNTEKFKFKMGYIVFYGLVRASRDTKIIIKKNEVFERI